MIMSKRDVHYFLFNIFQRKRDYMKRIDKNGKKRKLDIVFIYKKGGTKLEEILKEGYLRYLRNLKVMICFLI